MELSRIQLYELVWSKPIQKLAKEYGFSDVEFSKICRRHEIPLPVRGYWAKVSAGIKAYKVPLPNPNIVGNVYIPNRKSITDEEMLIRKKKLELEKLFLDKIDVFKAPNQLNAPHKITQNTQKYFEKILKNLDVIQNSNTLPNEYYSIINIYYRGRIRCKSADCFHVTVSKGSTGRALILLDVLVKKLEKYRFKIQNINDKDPVVAIKDNELINFYLTEGYKYCAIDEPKVMTKLERILYPDKLPVATGKLTFSVSSSVTNIARSWTDGKSPIELELPAIIHEFISLVPRQKQARIDELAKEELRNEELRISGERESQRYFEKSAFEEDIREAKVFRDHQDLDSYLNHLEIQYSEKYVDFSEQAIKWFSMIRKIALGQNPSEKRIKLLDK